MSDGPADRAADPAGQMALARLRFDAPEDDVVAVEALARASFEGESVSTREELARPWSRIWVARKADASAAPIGFLIAWHVADELHVLTVATAPALRRRGVARALMDEALGYARAEKIRVLLLEVRRSNAPAIALYRGLAFSVLGVRYGYYSDNGEDAIEMILALDPATGRALPALDEIDVDAPRKRG